MRIKLKGTQRGHPGARHSVVRIHPAKGVSEIEVRIGNSSVGRRIQGIEVQGMLEALDGLFQVWLVPFVPEIPAAEIRVIGLGNYAAGRSDGRMRMFLNTGVDTGSNGVCNVVMQR